MPLPPREEPASIDGFVTVQFVDEKYQGYEVVLRRNVPLADAFRVQQAMSGADDMSIMDAYKMIGAGLIVSWNLMRRVIGPDGEPVKDADGNNVLDPLPIDADSLLRQPSDFARAIYDTWVSEVLGESPNSPLPSSAGDDSAAAPTQIQERRSRSRRSSA